jgi:hypothetical protein
VKRAKGDQEGRGAIVPSVQGGVTLTASRDGQETVQQVSEKGLQAHLVLTPDGRPDLEPLGFVHLRIEAQPRSLPAMTPEATVEWLCTALKGDALISRQEGPPA